MREPEEDRKDNENCLEGIKCPKCGSLEPFWITGQTEFLTYDDGTEEHGDIEWDDDAAIRCDECGHTGKWPDFRIAEEVKP